MDVTGKYEKVSLGLRGLYIKITGVRDLRLGVGTIREPCIELEMQIAHDSDLHHYGTRKHGGGCCPAAAADARHGLIRSFASHMFNGRRAVKSHPAAELVQRTRGILCSRGHQP